MRNAIRVHFKVVQNTRTQLRLLGAIFDSEKVFETLARQCTQTSKQVESLAVK
jgi:hypothetical protein